ncbi:MAG: FAD:protein FMN transferase [Candidatus Synoicihabitans palmerolidicus]|nr:FAD:protein FMN transferase [Candidatus Synoicihabitans palmerolidicus]
MTPVPLVQIVELEGLTCFEHDAMATRYHVYLGPSDEGALRPIAEAVFRRLGELETRLSFYLEGSDVTRINRAAPDTSLRIDEVTHHGLLTVLDMAAATAGAFDPFAGAAALQAKSQAVPLPLADLPPPEDNDRAPVISIDLEQPVVTKLQGSRWLDLGAVGKGAALDAMAEVVLEWGITTAVLMGGGSSVLVLGPPLHPTKTTWTLVLPQLPGRPLLQLTPPFALGASGEGFQPGHIIAYHRQGSVWSQTAVVAASAAIRQMRCPPAPCCWMVIHCRLYWRMNLICLCSRFQRTENKFESANFTDWRFRPHWSLWSFPAGVKANDSRRSSTHWQPP